MLTSSLSAQSTPAELAQERSAFAEWLAAAPTSPLAAIAVQPIGAGFRLGPADAEVPLDGVEEHRISVEGGAVTLVGASGRRVLPSGRPVPLGAYTLAAAGAGARRTVTVYGRPKPDKAASYYPYDGRMVFVGPLSPPERPGKVRVLAADGVEVEAAEAGTVVVPIDGRSVRLLVRRIPTGAEDEAELEIFFRDATNDRGTYPAGPVRRAHPDGRGRYRLDLNRARNPFCAYSSVFPCPAPWRGNTIDAAVEAGERYHGGGLATPPGARTAVRSAAIALRRAAARLVRGQGRRRASGERCSTLPEASFGSACNRAGPRPVARQSLQRLRAASRFPQVTVAGDTSCSRWRTTRRPSPRSRPAIRWSGPIATSATGDRG